MVYVDADDDDCLMRVISRDIMRGAKESGMERYQKTVADALAVYRPKHATPIIPAATTK